MGGDFDSRAKNDMDEDALKQMIYLAIGGRRVVRTSVKELQFYTITGGGDGFLPRRNIVKDARWRSHDLQLQRTGAAVSN